MEIVQRAIEKLKRRRNPDPERTTNSSMGLGETPRGQTRVFFALDRDAFFTALDHDTGEFDSTKLPAEGWNNLPFNFIKEFKGETNGVVRALEDAADNALKTQGKLSKDTTKDMVPIVFSAVLPQDQAEARSRVLFSETPTWASFPLKIKPDKVWKIEGQNEYGRAKYSDVSEVYIPEVLVKTSK